MKNRNSMNTAVDTATEVSDAISDVLYIIEDIEHLLEAIDPPRDNDDD